MAFRGAVFVLTLRFGAGAELEQCDGRDCPDSSSLLQVKSQLAATAEATNPLHYLLGMEGPVFEKFMAPYITEGCGKPNKDQNMWFTGQRCSLASADMMYLSHSGEWKSAKKGDVIDLHCDDVQCPIPVIQDCYHSPNICDKDEWCWTRQHEKWGAWAQGPTGKDGMYGHTPNPSYCKKFVPAYNKAVEDGNMPEAQQVVLNSSRQLFCPEASEVWGDLAWRPIHGQCTKYRTEEQSCLQKQEFMPPFVGLDGPRFTFDEEAKPLERPLLCHPSLTCTGPDFNVRPSTCVPKRPPNKCYWGPWWNSLDCPAEHDKSPGLSYEVLMNATLSAGLLYEGEVLWPGSCAFWDRNQAGGDGSARIRHQVWLILKTLWPKEALGGRAAPSWETFNTLIETTFDPISYLLKEGFPEKHVLGVCQWMEKFKLGDHWAPAGYEAQAGHVQSLLAKAGHWAMMPNKVWSIVHFTTFNLPDQATEEQAYASRALATLLAQNFWCDDCRSFFQVGVIAQFGPPPVDNPSGLDIAKWWWHAHNVASEHVATTRGGHPWIHQSGDKVDYFGRKVDLQNPFYMGFEDAYSMWVVK